MSRTLTAHDEELLVAYKKLIESGHNRARKNHSASITQLWPYLARTPGEQLSLAVFGEIFGVVPGSATARLAGLVKHGLIRKTATRQGKGGGVGYICEWLEQRRERSSAAAGHVAPETTVETVETVEAHNGNGVSLRNDRSGFRLSIQAPIRDELDAIERIAEYCVSVVRPLVDQNSSVGIELIDAMRKIQASANRARLVSVPAKGK